VTVETDFRARALAHAPLVALVGQRVALNALPQDSVLPGVVYAVRHAEERTLDGTLVADDAAVEAQCWAKTGAEALAVEAALTAAVQHVESASSCTLIDKATAYDQETDLHAVQVTYQWLV
jgi:hypothetical protein